jgi:hypothetical protein
MTSWGRFLASPSVRRVLQNFKNILEKRTITADQRFFKAYFSTPIVFGIRIGPLAMSLAGLGGFAFGGVLGKLLGGVEVASARVASKLVRTRTGWCRHRS